MIDLDDALGSLTDVATHFDEPVHVIMARARRRTRRRRAVRAICVVVVINDERFICARHMLRIAVRRV